MITKREKSAILGMVANIYTMIVMSLMPFIVRTVLVRFIGIEYVGVSSLFASIIQVLNIFDFGLVTALAYYIYKPALENDFEAINIYMRFFRKLFFLCGSIILIGGLLVMPFLPVLVKGKEYPPGLNIYVVYLIYLLQTALFYFANSHIGTLLVAHLKAYINSVITGTALLIMYSVQIFSVVIFRNYYYFSAALLISVIIQGFFYVWVKKRHFPWLKYEGELPDGFMPEFRKRVSAMIISKIRTVSRNSLDSVIISFFLGLTILAKYQNYFQVMLVPLMMTYMMRGAVQPSLGNGIAGGSKESNYGMVKQYLFINSMVAAVCMTCLLSLIQPFMKLWMGQEYLLGNDIVICIAIYYYVLCVSDAVMMMREATGIWWEGRWVAVLESVLNLILNLIFVQLLGLYGIVLATILTVALINIPLEGYYVIKGAFDDKYRDYMRITIIYLIKAVFIAFISWYLCLQICIVNYGTMLIRIMASVLLPGILFVALNFGSAELKGAAELIKRTLKSLMDKVKK